MAMLPKIKLKTVVTFPSNAVGGTGIDVTKQDGNFHVDLDYSEFATVTSLPVPSSTNFLVYDTVTGQYTMMPASLFGGGSTGIAEAPNDGIMYGRQSRGWTAIPTGGGSVVVEQHITTAGPVTILGDTNIVRVNQTVGAPITLNMGFASNKTTPVLIIDWKGDAGTNNITIALSGSDRFPGGLTSWVIAANNGSVMLRPISTIGYAL